MLDRRAARIVWAFLIAVIALEGWALSASFAGAGGAAKMWRYFLTPAGTPTAWALAALIAILYAAHTASGSDFIRAHMLHPSRWRPFAFIRLIAVPMALISGFFEEAFFRKTLMDILLHHGATLGVQIAVSALAFGAVHAVWGLLGGSVRGALAAMLATTALGAALAVVYAIGGRAIGPCIAAHTAINLVIEPWLIIAAATQSWNGQSAKAGGGRLSQLG